MTIIQPLQTRFALDHEIPEHRAVRAGLARASWGSARNLTAEQRATLRAIMTGESVEIKEIVGVVVAGLHASVTRWGQSMARRSGSQPLLDLYGLLPTASGPVVDAQRRSIEAEHRARVEQAQAREITDLRQRREALARENRAQATLIADQQAEMLRLQALLHTAESALPQRADMAAHGFALDIMTGEQRQRVSDFRTGYRAADRG